MNDIDWNDMSDSDESSDEDQTQMDEIPKPLKKIESSPSKPTRLRMACIFLFIKVMK